MTLQDKINEKLSNVYGITKYMIIARLRLKISNASLASEHDYNAVVNEVQGLQGKDLSSHLLTIEKPKRKPRAKAKPEKKEEKE